MADKFNGVIEKLFIKFNEKTKKQSISIINNGNFYGLGLYDEKFVKVGDVALKEGMQVEFEYSGKFKNINMDTFKIISQEVPKAFKKAMKDDDLPMRLGNAINVATFLTKSKSDIISVAKQILPMIDDLRDKLENKYPNMTEKGLGSRCGQCVLIAAQYATNINDFIGLAEELFEEICRVEEELKGVPRETVKKEDNNCVQNNLTRNTVSVEHNEPTIVEWDESIPF